VPGQLRVLRRRIRSVQSTKKITRAMELIAASRIVRAQQRVSAARPYAEQISHVITNLAAAGAGGGHRLLGRPGQGPSGPSERGDAVRRVGYVVLTSDRGLAGGYNANVIRAVEQAVRADIEAGRGYSLVTVGRKGQGYFRYRRYDIEASYTGMSDLPTYEDARQVAGEVMRMFETGEVDVVKIGYTRFLSLGTQRPTVAQLMPMEQPEAGEQEGPPADYEFEPGPGAILDRLLPRYVEARVFAAMLESSASEHAARQRAMKSATDNADELMKSLSRIADRVRQDEITTEITEIVGGAEALRPASGAGR
jgi:F-type H+-transporting ATPase subunit gamma